MHGDWQHDPDDEPGRPELVRRLRDEIERQGRITFERFMQLALYEPGLGYYASLSDRTEGSSSALADFQTSPQVHPAFGHLVARHLLRLWNLLGRPDPLVLAELGAGALELAKQVLAGLGEQAGPPRVEYHAIDARYRQDGRTRSLGTAPDQQSYLWGSLDAFAQAGIQVHCVLANEFFDALPVHRVAWVGGELREVYVGWGRHGFVEHFAEPSCPDLARWIEERGGVPPEGWQGEICLRLAPTLERIAAVIKRGAVLTIDYGYLADEAYDPHRVAGTLLAYHRHRWSDDLYRRIGQQDLTCHVDFGALVRLGRRFGLEPVLLTTQREFLLGLGLAAEAERWLSRESTAAGRWQARFQLAELVSSNGLGRLRVLLQQRGLPNPGSERC